MSWVETIYSHSSINWNNLPSDVRGSREAEEYNSRCNFLRLSNPAKGSSGYYILHKLFICQELEEKPTHFKWDHSKKWLRKYLVLRKQNRHTQHKLFNTSKRLSILPLVLFILKFNENLNSTLWRCNHNGLAKFSTDKNVTSTHQGPCTWLQLTTLWKKRWFSSWTSCSKPS